MFLFYSLEKSHLKIQMASEKMKKNCWITTARLLLKAVTSS